MTQTAAQLRQLGLPHARARAGAVLLASAGVGFGIAAAGLWLAPWALAIATCWLAIAIVAAGALWAARRAGRASGAGALARLVESAAGARAGSVVGVVPAAAGRGGASAELFALADARAAHVVAASIPRVDRMLGRDTRRRLLLGGAAACAGAALFIAASPAPGRAAFWHPLRALAAARASVRLLLDRETVHRGDSVTVTIEVPGATGGVGTEGATLWTRSPGEPWQASRVALDARGRGVKRVGPLEADLYLRAGSGSRQSGERKVSVTLPAFIAGLEITAQFPPYLQRAEQQIVPGSDTVLLPAGTVLLTSGALSVPLRKAAWVHPYAGETIPLTVRGGIGRADFSGRFVPRTSGAWRLDVTPADGSTLESDAPELHLRVVPDSAPSVSVPVPGRDTTLPITLRQPLVIDVRDDHGVARVEVVSWRASRTGKVGEPIRQALDASGAGDRALIQGELDAERRGLLPGDTLRFRVEAWDNAPVPHKGQSAEIALRLPSLEELRSATRLATRDIAAATDSLAAAQGALSERTSDLAHERPRDAAAVGRRAAGAQAGTLPFEASERAGAIERQQTELQQRAKQLAQQIEQVARAAQAAGLTDTAFQARLAEVQQLLQRALTPELEQRLRELQEALGRLDSEAARAALEHLAEAQRQFREELERSQDLFRRAAVEGALASLAADAEELRGRQAEWNRADAPRPDSAGAGRERALAARADSLARGIAQAAADLAQAASPEGGRGDSKGLVPPHVAAERAQAAMHRAANAAGQQNSEQAGVSGAAAEAALAEIPDELRRSRDSLAQAWRGETLDALDRALAETAALAARQQQVAESLRKGDAAATIRSRQASVEEGTAAVERQIRAAAGRHAMVSPQLERALGFAQRQMRAAREELSDADPSVQSAADLAEQSVDALNATAFALARSRGEVEGARSGTGFAEAMEQLSRLAREQGRMNGQAQGLLPLAAAGGEAVLEQLRAIAAQQRALAEQLERLEAEGASQAAGALAHEARELAALLDAGRLDPQTIQRQEGLYRRLLDAGRTLTGPEPDEQKQRASRAATSDSVHVPLPFAPGATGVSPRLRYPRWDELHDLTPEQRRLVLEYFRRLNAPQR